MEDLLSEKSFDIKKLVKPPKYSEDDVEDIKHKSITSSKQHKEKGTSSILEDDDA